MEEFEDGVRALLGEFIVPVFLEPRLGLGPVEALGGGLEPLEEVLA